MSDEQQPSLDDLITQFGGEPAALPATPTVPSVSIDMDTAIARFGGVAVAPTAKTPRDLDALIQQFGGQQFSDLEHETIANAPPRQGTAVRPAKPIDPSFFDDQHGVLAPPNIDLYAQPRVKNPDGTISTVRSMSFEEDGHEILVPTVAADGSRILSDEEAIDQYHRTGKHLGIYASPDVATAYAQQLHDDYAAGTYDRTDRLNGQHPEARIGATPAPPPMPTYARGRFTGLPGRDVTSATPEPLTDGAIQLARGAKQASGYYSQPTDDTLNGASDMIEGAFKMATPAAMAAAIINLPTAVLGFGLTAGASKAASTGTALAGGSPAAQRFAGNVAAAVAALGVGSRIVDKVRADAQAVAAQARAFDAEHPPEPTSTEPIPVGSGRTPATRGGNRLPPERPGLPPAPEPEPPPSAPPAPAGVSIDTDAALRDLAAADPNSVQAQTALAGLLRAGMSVEDITRALQELGGSAAPAAPVTAPVTPPPSGPPAPGGLAIAEYEPPTVVPSRPQSSPVGEDRPEPVAEPAAPADAQPFSTEAVHVTTTAGADGILNDGYRLDAGNGLGGDHYGPGVYLADYQSDSGGFWREQLATKNESGRVETRALRGQVQLQRAFIVEDMRPVPGPYGAGMMRPLDRRDIVARRLPTALPRFDALVQEYRGSQNRALGQVVRDAGYDGIVFERRAGKEIIAFDPTAVRWTHIDGQPIPTNTPATTAPTEVLAPPPADVQSWPMKRVVAAYNKVLDRLNELHAKVPSTVQSGPDYDAVVQANDVAKLWQQELMRRSPRKGEPVVGSQWNITTGGVGKKPQIVVGTVREILTAGKKGGTGIHRLRRRARVGFIDPYTGQPMETIVDLEKLKVQVPDGAAPSNPARVEAPTPKSTGKNKSIWSTLDDEYRKAFWSALHSIQGNKERWQALATRGATDDEILQVASRSFGISGGSTIGAGNWHSGGAKPTLRLGATSSTRGIKLSDLTLAHTIREALAIPYPTGATGAAVQSPTDGEAAPAPVGPVEGRDSGERAPTPGQRPESGRGHSDRPRTREPRERPVSRKTREADRLKQLVDQAIADGYEGDPAPLYNELRDRLELLKELDVEMRDDGRNPSTLLRAIATLGGISLDKEDGHGGKIAGYPGEIRWLKEHREPNGTMRGIRGVFRDAGGHTLDRILEGLRQEARFQYLETIDDLIEAIRDAATADPAIDVLDRFVKSLGYDWWERIGHPPTEAIDEERDSLEPDDDGLVSFDVNEFGEEQARLPGAEDARQVGEADTSFRAPVQASGDDFNLFGETTPERAEQDARNEAPSMFDAAAAPAIELKYPNSLSVRIYRALVGAEWPTARDSQDFRKIVAQRLGVAEREIADDIDALNDAAEAALLELFQPDANLQTELTRARDTEALLPRAHRTLEKTKLQQFSTPLPIAVMAARAAQVRTGDRVLEPTAGTGNLLAPLKNGRGLTIVASELSARRADLLRLQGYNVLESDYLSAKVTPPDVIISNPPWGKYTTGKYGSAVGLDFTPNDVAERFVAKMLRDLAPDGRLVAVMPTTMLQSPQFRKWLRTTHTVQAIIQSPPGSYDTRATSVESILLVVDKVKPAAEKTAGAALVAADSWEAYAQAVQGIPPRARTERRPGAPTQPAPERGSDVVSERPRSELADTGRDTPVSGGRHPGVVAGQRGSADTGQPAGTRPPVVEQPHTATADALGTAQGEFTDVVDHAKDERRAAAGSRQFAPYIRRTALKGVGHPKLIVEARQLAGVPYPALTEPAGTAILTALREKRVSVEQAEQALAAVQANVRYGHGYLAADNVGVGKSREIALTILELMERAKRDGRQLRLIVTTKSADNIVDLIDNELYYVATGRTRDGRDLLNVDAPKVMPPSLDFEIVRASEWPDAKREGNEYKPFPVHPRAIYVTDFYNLAAFRQGLIDVQPHGIIGDEAHRFKNVEGAAAGGAWQNLHAQILRNVARKEQTFAYFTATPAQDVSDYQYLYGLRLWPIDGFQQWVQLATGSANEKDAAELAAATEAGAFNIDKVADGEGATVVGGDAEDTAKQDRPNRYGGRSIDVFATRLTPAEAEQIPREWKLMGRFSARDLWRAGQEFIIHEAKLPMVHADKYDQFVDLAQEIAKKAYQFGLLDQSGKSSRFGVTGQLQFAAKRIQMQPALEEAIRLAQEKVAAGYQVVLSVINVSEMDPEKGNIAAAIEKINTRVKDVDPDDPDGGVIDLGEIPEALVAKAELLEQAKLLGTFDDPIKMVEDAFGADKVALIVGNSGTQRRVAMKEFQEGKRPVALLSQAGSTGINLDHRVLTKKGPGHGRRVFIDVQFEWSATEAIQRYGRVGRSASVTQPILMPLTFGNASEKKFLATIANRMASLGALSKGGAETTGASGLEEFEITGPDAAAAARLAYNDLPQEHKRKFAVVKSVFRNPNRGPDDPFEPAATAPSSAGMRDFQLALLFVPLRVSNAFWQSFVDHRVRVRESLGHAITSRTEALTGDVLRTTDLGEPGRPLTLFEVKNQKGNKYGILTGLITPRMPQIREHLFTEDPTTHLQVFSRRYVTFTTEDDQIISGLQIPWGRVKALADAFGHALAGEKLDTPEKVLAALKAGEVVTLQQGGDKRWTLKLRQDARITIGGATMGDRTLLLHNGGAYSPVGNYWFTTAEKLAQFLERFPVAQPTPKASRDTHDHALPLQRDSDDAAQFERDLQELRGQSDREPQFMRAGDGHIRAGMGDEARAARVMASSLYSKNVEEIAPKELLQNAFDATKRLGDQAAVTITFRDNPGEQSVEVTDNGPGLTREQIETVFTNLFESGKASDAGASGGFGVAKASFLLGGAKVEFETVVETRNLGPISLKKRFTFTATPDELTSTGGVQVHEAAMNPSTPTGTRVRTYINPGATFAVAEAFARTLARTSMDLQGTFTVQKRSRWMHEVQTVAEVTPASRRAAFADWRRMALRSVPGADLQVAIAPTHDERQYVTVRILNNGIYQFDAYIATTRPGTIESPPVLRVPTEVIVDVHATVPEAHGLYPFTANREVLRNDFDEAMKRAVWQAVVAPALADHVDTLQDTYDRLPRIPGQTGDRVFLDVGGRFTPEELQTVFAEPAMQGLIREILHTTDEVLQKLYPNGHSVERVGLLFDPENHGVYIPDPSAPGDARRATILINPFQHLVFDPAPEAAAAAVYHTIVHEAVHEAFKGHDERFTSGLARAFRTLGARLELGAVRDLWTAYHEADDDTTLDRGLAGVLRLYVASRGRAATTEDALSRTARHQRRHDDDGRGPQRMAAGDRSDRSGTPARTVTEHELRELARRHGTSVDVQRARAEAAGYTIVADNADTHDHAMPLQTVPPIARAAETLRAAGKDITATLTAPTVSQAARLSSRHLRKRLGELMHTLAFANHALTDYRNAVERLTLDHDEILRLADILETGEGELPKFLQPWGTIRTQVFDYLKKQIAALGIEKQWREHYLGHVWEAQFKDGQSATDRALRLIGRRPLQGPKSFLKHRTIPTMRQGVARGLEPKTWNLVEIDLFKIEEMSKFILGRQALNDNRSLGTWTFVSALRKPPTGMVQIPDPIGAVWAPPQITVKEAYDALLTEGLESLIHELGIPYSRVAGTMPWLGRTNRETNAITMRVGAPEGALMHELGHALDNTYGLYRIIATAIKTPEFEGEKGALGELRALAALRYAGGVPTPDFAKYVQKQAEQIANLVHAYLWAPDEAKRVAPRAYDAFESFVMDHEELHPLLELQKMRSVVIAEREATYRLPGPILLGRYYAAPEVARIFTNYLTPGLGAHPLFQVLRIPSNALVQLKLSLSAFHALTVSIEGTSMAAGRMMRDLLHGKPLAAAKQAAKVLVEPIDAAARGHAIRNQYLTTLDPLTLAVDAATNLLIAGGGRVEQSREYTNRSMAKFADNLRRANEAYLRGMHGRVLSESTQAAIRLLPAMIEAGAWPILQWFVPRVKAAAAVAEIQKDLEHLPGVPTEDTLLAIASKAVNLTDATLGEVIWDNYFLPRALMSAVQLVIMAPGWRGGSAVMLARGLTDPIRKAFPGQREDYRVRVPVSGGASGGGGGSAPPPTDGASTDADAEPPPQYTTVTVKEPYWSAHTTFLIGQVFVAILIAELYQHYLHHADHPRTVKDVAYPQTGTRLPNGEPERSRIPGYAGIFYDILRRPPQSIIEYLIGGEAPFAAMLPQLWRNETSFGEQITEPGDPWSAQLKDYLTFLKGQLAPISVSSYGRRAGTPAEKAESVLGLSPAPRRITDTPLEEYLHQVLPPAHKSREQAKRATERRNLREAIRTTPAGGERPTVDTSHLSPGMVRQTAKQAFRSPLPSMVQQLSITQALHAYGLASPEERAEIRAAVSRKLPTGLASTPPAERAALMQAYRKAMQLPVAPRLNAVGATP